MFDNLRRRLAWRAELRELDQKQAPATLAKPDDSNPGRLLWCLPVPGKTDVFMALEKGEHADHDRFVVPVNAVAFNRLWLAGGLNSRERPDGCLLRRDMPADSKYRHAAACFAEGPQSPVPLASVSLERDRNGTQSVRFNDGMTRSIWLLANNVAAFPVLIAGEAAAKQLAQLAGTDGSILRVSEAFRQVEKAPESPQKPVSTKNEGVGQVQANNAPQRAAQGHRRPFRGGGIGID
ncbi:plasmid fertility inhibition factor family protein [Escherichia coli]|uniref:plasmid fertility inhibition factor family protein n=1 Tax=Proteus mirabilis TaxID=584 RepID=UPI00107D410F|nr:fertility inhibition factor FiwA [Proteus mirabilis]EAA0907905.1 fertility inhibition factor FiwA [Salmonella enterica subsp. enterica serovar Kentucky]MDM3765729.1 fertility inhibition factor FiwA [Proteus mirabilis]